MVWKHNGRGQSENRHKELKSGMGMEQMPCGQFEGNAMYFAIRVPAYDLGQVLKRRVLRIKADLEKWKLLESARLCCARLQT